MTVLVVDDEIPLRSYLSKLVDWEGHGYHFLEAENGAAALEIMQQTPVHLLMLDITMPVMTGLEVLEWVNQNHYHCITAILTSHDEFRYAQEALRLGCFDYIIKTEITGDSILALAGRMQQRLSEELQKQRRQDAMEIALRRQETAKARNVISFWLTSGGNRVPNITQHFEKHLGFPDGESRYVLVQITIRDYASVLNRYMDSDAVRFSVVFDNVLDELLYGYCFFYSEYDPGNFLIFLRFDLRDSTHKLLDCVHKLTRQIDDSFTNLLRIYCRILFTLPFLAIASAADYYHLLQKQRSWPFWQAPEEILCLNDFLFDEALCSDELAQFRQEFSLELASRNLLRIGAKYDEMIGKITLRRYCIPPESFKHVCGVCAAAFLDSRPAADITALQAAEDCASFKSALMAVISPFCISEENQDKKLLVKKALLLIQQRFQDEIGLEWLAAQLLVNSSYLSRVFSAEVGQPLISYIQSYRIEKAKQLIRTTNLKLYEVAERTGFLSQIVFSSTFKKITGETPTEYKNRNG